MLYYDIIDIGEAIDVGKTSASKQCNICYYWYFLDKGFKFQPYVCNGCHDLLMMSTKLNNIAVLNINSVNYPCIIKGISKNEAKNFMQNINLSEIKHVEEITTFGDNEIEKH